MILTNELKGIIVARGFNREQMAKMLEITPKTFTSKMKKGVFGSDEIEIMIEKLEISDPMSIFFAKK